ncbi:MAG: hypothetical protein K2Y01_05345 [Rhabdochlamydiaceae bacterium]|nr:hypothetical protein [Rhabdochlamydiaceae bacterium]
MYVRLQDETVRRNIEVFKIILKRASSSVDAIVAEKKEKEFKAFVHRIKGEVRFADLSAEPLDTKDWLLVSFRFSLPKNAKESLHCEVLGPEGASFSWDGFQEVALSVLKETIKTIQFMSRFLPSLQNLSRAFRDFSQINLDAFLEEMPAKDLIHEAWCQLDREECERLLLQKSAGTFLFRQDFFTAILEKLLTQTHQKQIKCITLTYIDAWQKVSDLTLVKKKEGWMIYNDDPCLRATMYPTVRALLDRFKGVLKSPVLHF